MGRLFRGGGGGNGRPIDLDLEEVENYGADVELEQFLQNIGKRSVTRDRNVKRTWVRSNFSPRGEFYASKMVGIRETLANLKRNLRGRVSGATDVGNCERTLERKAKGSDLLRKTIELIQNGRN